MEGLSVHSLTPGPCSHEIHSIVAMKIYSLSEKAHLILMAQIPGRVRDLD